MPDAIIRLHRQMLRKNKSSTAKVGPDQRSWALWLSLVGGFCLTLATDAAAENSAIYDIPPGAEITIETPATTGGSYSANLAEGFTLSGISKGQKIIQISQKAGMAASCSGSSCLGVTTLLCPLEGKVTAQVKNFLNQPIKIVFKRLDCDGADKDSVLCPQPSTVSGVCGRYTGD